ncbi:hypothetical protein G6F37_012801 [Rhizopus arrhizus]|nr:hypothetical protein G6F38_012898 [Rhizopus arrhizus]KAG1141513.1 hypothetical protein G6F37_012801 [Rhizopus arrhizus]
MSKHDRSDTGNTSMDKSILVPNATQDETPQRANNLEDKPMESYRVALINNKRKGLGMSDQLISHLNKANRPSTTKLYNTAWTKSSNWCIAQQLDPEIYDIHQVLKFLTAFSHLSPSTLNGYRSSIASVFNILFPDSTPLAEDPDIIAFFRAKRQCTTIIPKLTDLESWDTDILTHYIQKNLSPSERLSLYDLQQKLVLLLCLHTMWRPRSDIGRLQFRDTLLRYAQTDQTLSGVVLHIREPKEAQQKTIQLGLLSDDQTPELCVVRCLERFIQETKAFRTNLPEDHTLLLTYLNKPDETPPTSIKGKTVAAWVKRHMAKAGISEDYSAHSIRAACSTKAVPKRYLYSNG